MINRFAQVDRDYLPYRGRHHRAIHATNKPETTPTEDHELQTRRFPPEASVLVRHMAQAKELPCREYIDVFDAALEKGRSDAVRQAQQLCYTCPEFNTCSLLADMIQPTHGVWAGKKMPI